MKKLFLFILAFQFAHFAFSQNEVNKPLKIAVFSPIFLDSVFNGNTYKLTNNSLPKTVLPGLEFYNGVMMAIDSLEKENIPVEIYIFDSKSGQEPMSTILEKPIWDSISFIIASFKERNEIKPLADFAAKKNIPLVSATFPNDGGVSENPFFVLVNSTLRTHCEGLYKHIQKYYSTGNMVYVKKKGNVEDAIQNIFIDMGKNTPAIPLRYKTIELTDTFTYKQLFSSLDSTKQNVVFCGTISEEFGKRLVKVLGTSKAYRSIAIGMPTWDGIKDFNKTVSAEASKGIEIVYSSPYLFFRTEKLGKLIANRYKDKYFARPSDWFFKGYESMYIFTKLLIKYQNDFINHLSDKDFKLFNDFDFQPVYIKKENATPDYLENKKLYFIKKQDGVVKSVI